MRHIVLSPAGALLVRLAAHASACSLLEIRHPRGPGQLVAGLSREERTVLQELTSDEAQQIGTPRR